MNLCFEGELEVSLDEENNTVIKKRTLKFLR